MSGAAGVTNGVQQLWGSDDGGASVSLQSRMAPAEPAAGSARMMQAGGGSGGASVDAGMSNTQQPRLDFLSIMVLFTFLHLFC